jgi:hypothetical protein
VTWRVISETDAESSSEGDAAGLLVGLLGGGGEGLRAHLHGFGGLRDRIDQRLHALFEVVRHLAVLGLPLAQIGRELDDLVGLAARVEDRIVGRLDPDFLAALAEALVLRGLELAAIELRPELAVLGAGGIGRVGEHGMVAALDFVQGVPHHVEEIPVGGQDGAVEFELDDGLRTVDGVHLAIQVGKLHPLLRHVGRELDDLVGLAVGVEDRVVRRLDPHLLAALAEALVLRRLELAAVELRPEFAVLGAGREGRLGEHRMVLAFDLGEAVAHHVEEIPVGGQDRAVEFELDDGLGFVERVGQGRKFACLRFRNRGLAPCWLVFRASGKHLVAPSDRWLG